MNLSKFNTKAAYAKPIAVELVHPAYGTPVGVTINVWGAGSQVYQNAADNIARAALERMQKQGRSAALDPANARSSELDLAQSITESWDMTDDDNAPLPCTTENARKQYTEAPWALAQVLEAASDPKRVFKA